MSSQIKAGYNFQNVSVNYRYGAERSSAIPGFKKPVNQKDIKFGLAGKSLGPGVNLGLTRAVVNPLFEEYEEVQLSEGIYGGFDPEETEYVEVRKFLRLTGLDVLNAGNGYSASNPVQISFSNLGDPRISGGFGQIYDQPILDIVTANGGLSSYSIIDGGRFEGSYEVNITSGESVDFIRTGTGFFGSELDTPAGGWDYISGVYTGTGFIYYNEFSGGVEPYPSTGSGHAAGTGITGTFSGFVVNTGFGDNPTNSIDNVFQGVFADYLNVFFRVQDDDEFIFNENGSYFVEDSLIFSEIGVEPFYTAKASDPPNLEAQGDIRNGINYSNWNSSPPDPSDRNAYTHIIQNPNVDSVSAIINISKLNDTLHKADSVFKVTEKPNWLGRGDLKVDAAFRIGNPTDSFVKIKIEWGFLNTELNSSSVVNYQGQTIGGYLVETQKYIFDSYKTLQSSSAKYQSLSIKKLKSTYPKYIRVSKNMYETDSSLINRNVMLDSIKEHFDTEFNYPSSALVATNIDSTYFDNIPTRTYDAKLKKVWVPETYNIKHRQEDKRFRKSEIDETAEIEFLGDKRIYGRYSKTSVENTQFGNGLAVSDGDLFVFDTDWGTESQNAFPDDNKGNIFVYQGMGKEIDAGSNDFMMIRDGIPRSSRLRTMTGQEPQFDISDGDIGNTTDGFLQSPIRVAATHGFGGYLLAGYKMNATNSLLLRVSPKKQAILEGIFSYDVPNNQSARELIKYACGVVIGTVRDPYAKQPDQVIGTINYFNNDSSRRQYYVNNTSETKYLYVKIFSAQVAQAGLRATRIDVGEFGVGFIWTYPAIGPLYSPENYNYSPAAIHPDSISCSAVSLKDLSMGDYYFASQTPVLKVQGPYLIVEAQWNRASNGTIYVIPVLLVLKKDDNGFWYPQQHIVYKNDLSLVVRISSVTFFPNEDKFAIIWRDGLAVTDNRNRIEIYSLVDGLFVLESSFRDFQGIFEGYDISYSSFRDNFSFCSALDTNTLIVSSASSVNEEDNYLTKNTLRGVNHAKNVLVYKKDELNAWSLQEIVFRPDFYGDSFTSPWGPKIDTAGPWLAVGGHTFQKGPIDGITDVGVVLLYRYNGKKYEYITRFYSDAVKDFDSNGDPIKSNDVTQFGEHISLNLNSNQEPVVIVSAKGEDTATTKGFIYVFERNPHTDEWEHEKTNSFVGGEAIYNSREEVPLMASDGENIAFALQGISSVMKSVGTVSFTSLDKSTRIYEDKNWFGMMKKSWTDNPAWIIYDLLTNPIYGAGSLLDDLKDINIFNFYQVSKYFDSCDENGYYIPIYDEKGQTEPRLSCNFLLDGDFNAFETISSICDMFFGSVYIKEGKYNLWADRPTAPSWYFNNLDVLDGNFSYSDSTKTSRPNLIKVPFLDKNENFKEKIEFIEDAELMRKNGKIESNLQFTAFTSRAQARRFGKQYLFNNSYETEKIKFQTDSKALFLDPGDVIGINDELKTFETENVFWKVHNIDHTEKVYAVQYAKSSTETDKFLFSEITFNNGDTENFDVEYIEKDNGFSTSAFLNFDITLDNSGVPYIFAAVNNGDFGLYRKNGNDFDQAYFDEDDLADNFSRTFQSNLAFDTSNKPYFSFVAGSGISAASSEPLIGFAKLTGSDFTNTGDWKFTTLDYLDSNNEGWLPTNTLRSVVKINSNDEKYILTHRYDTSPYSGEYYLYYHDGLSDETNPNSWSKHSIDKYGSRSDNNLYFDMELINDKPAIAYHKPIPGEYFARQQIRYKEFIGPDLNADWVDCFVWGSEPDTQTNFYLKFNKSGVPHITHNNDENDGVYIHSPLSYNGRFSPENWIDNTAFVKFRSDLGDKMEDGQLHFLQNGNYLLFSENYEKLTPGSTSNIGKRSLQFEESSSAKEWGQIHNWQKRYIYKTDVNKNYSYTTQTPAAISSAFEGCVITLEDPYQSIFGDSFSIDTSIKNNLEITNFSAREITGLYNETKFENFSKQVKNQLAEYSAFVSVTGWNSEDGFINLFLEQSEENSKIVNNLVVGNPLVRPIKVQEDYIDNYKEYRVLNIVEKEPNLYEIEAKEYFSGKFDIIDNFARSITPQEPEFNIGLPTNEINRPPEPLGVQYQTGVDDAGSPFLTGLITGETNGSETEYRLSLFYPNGKHTTKEIEKNTNNLSPLNQPLTDFGFYNLAAVGDYQLNVKSLRNPESSDFVNKKFTVSDFKEKLTTYPSIGKVNLLVKEESLKINVIAKNVYGDPLNLFDSNCRINIKIENELYVEGEKLTDFEISFQQIKDLTNSDSREKDIKVELTYNGIIISEQVAVLRDEPPKINDIKLISDGSSINIVSDISETEKLICLDMKTGDSVIKTFAIHNQNKIQNLRLEDFEISELPKKQKINFSFVPKDFYGTGQSYDSECYIPEKESVFEKYNESMIAVYSIHSEDEFSDTISSYNSSNGETGFYGNGTDCLVEFSSSLVSGNSASLNLQINSETDSKSISIEFNNQGFLATKKVLNLPNKYYNINISGDGGLFEGFELKIKKLV